MNRLLSMALIVVIGLGIGLGFGAVGGPGFARMEKNDRQRAQDLRSLAQYYSCQNLKGTETQEGGVPNGCSRHRRLPDVTDPKTGSPYRYEQMSDTEFEVCATFETSDRQQSSYPSAQIIFEAQEGCLKYQREDASKHWQIQ